MWTAASISWPDTSAFLRVKMGEALAARGLAPSIYESAAEARAHLLALES